MMPILFNAIALLLIAFIVWWFWFSKPKLSKSLLNVVKIKVEDGVYEPSRVEVSSSKPITLEFLRYDISPCSEYVHFDSLGIQHQLPINKKYEIKLGKLNKGVYSFNCQMKMYVGELVVGE